MPDDERPDRDDYEQVKGFIKPDSEVFTLSRGTHRFEPATVVSCKRMYEHDPENRHEIILHLGLTRVKILSSDCYTRRKTRTRPARQDGSTCCILRPCQ